MRIGVTSPPLCALEPSERAVGLFRLLKVSTLTWPFLPIRPQLRINDAPPNSVGWIESE